MQPDKPVISRQFAIFLLVGLACALIDIATIEFFRLAGAHYSVAVSLGFGMGVIANYILHTKFTFKTSSSQVNFLKFACIVALNYGATLLFVVGSTHFLGSVLMGKIASLPVVSINGFLLSRYWAFK